MSSNASRAKSFLSDLLDGEDELKAEIAAAEAAPPEPDEQWVVYYMGDKPDTAWSYHHKPDDGIPYGRLEGYWDEDKEAKVARHFVPNRSTQLKVMDFETFMDRIVPNKDCTKIFDSEGDFLRELI